MLLASGQPGPAQEFWGCLASMETGAGLMADWTRQAGGALAGIRLFLMPGCDQAEHHPCRAHPQTTMRAPNGLWHVGTYSPLGMPALLALRLETKLAGALGAWDLETKGCILLTPRDPPANADLLDALKRNGVFPIMLNQILEPGPGGVFIARTPLEKVLAPWIDHSRRLRRAGSMLEAIQREISALRTALDLRPNALEPLPESVASQVFAMVRAMDEGAQKRKAPMLQVFRLYCEEGLTAAKIARRLNCAKSLVLLRLAELEKRIGRRPSELRALAGHFDGLEKSVQDPRARKIYRGG